MAEPRIQYAKTEDGVSIAFTARGKGPPLVWAVHHNASHQQLEWELMEPILAPTTAARTLIRFDHRGSGLSDRGVEDLSIDALVLDLEAVVERLSLPKFALAGSSRGGLVAAAYAARHPNQVSHLILYDGFARGADYLALPKISTLYDLAARDWEMYTESAGGENFGYDHEAARRLAALMRASVNQDDFLRMNAAMADYDITDELAGIEAPTLVIRHAGLMTTTMEMAKHLAAAIPNARLVVTEGRFGERDDMVGKIMVDFLSEGETAEAQAPLPSGTAIILFLDIAGSTALTTKLGDAAYRERERDLDTALRAAITETGGTPVEGKVLGDGIMAVFTSARQAIEAAQRCRDLGNEAGLPLHLGIHAGDVAREGNNVHGGAVQVAARVQGIAVPGEILVSDIVRGLARTSAGVAFKDRGEHEVKGIDEPQRLFAVREPD